MKWIGVVLMVLFACSVVSADEISDGLERALALYKAGNFVGARSELERVTRLLEPKAIAQIPPPTVKDLTYTNYEHAFKVSAPGKEWRIQPLVVRSSTSNGITTMLTMTHEKAAPGEIVIYCVRDNLRQAMGDKFEAVSKDPKAALQTWGRESTTLVGNLKDTAAAKLTEFKVGESPAVKSEFSGKRDGTLMHCWVVHVLAGERLFTGIFLSTEANWAAQSKDFDKMIATMATNVAMPDVVLQPTEKTE